MIAVRPKKQLGQHFLTDLSIARRIADTLQAPCPVQVLEVGPGMGVLTQFLLQNTAFNLRLIEIDNESVEYLRSHYPALGDNLIQGDFLKMDLSQLFNDEPFALIGNYPYNISSQIFFKALEHRNRIPLITGMVQKEVAERMAAKPGGKTYGILSVLLQAYYDIEYLFTVPPGVFCPPPKVQSAVFRMRRNQVQSLDCDEAKFKTVVKTAFGQRRKTLRNSLKPLLAPGFDTTDPIFDQRPERLSVADFVALTRRI